MTSALTPEQVSALLAGPAGAPPAGVIPQLEGAPNIQIVGRAWDSVGLVLMILTVSMRLYAQWFMTKQYVLEDFLVIAGVAIFIALYAFLIIVQTSDYSSGYHMWDRTLAIFIKTQKLVGICEILYVPAFALVKVGILLQLRRTFCPTASANRWLRWACYTWMFVIVVFYTIVLFLDIFQCSPRAKAWNPFVPGTCVIKNTTVFLFTAFFNTISDFLILALPLPAIYALHMALKKKLLIAGLFATGGLACVVSIIRLYYSFVIVNGTDLSWNYVALGISAFFEGVIGIVVYSLPVAPRFFQMVQTKIYYYSSKRSTGQDSERDQSGFQQMQPVERKITIPRRQPRDDIGVSSIDKYLGPESRQSGRAKIPASSRINTIPSEESLSTEGRRDSGNENISRHHEIV